MLLTYNSQTGEQFFCNQHGRPCWNVAIPHALHVENVGIDVFLKAVEKLFVAKRLRVGDMLNDAGIDEALACGDSCALV